MQPDKKTELLKNIKAIRDDVTASFEELKGFAIAELNIDEFDLDLEAFRTPRLHTRWLDLLGAASTEYKKVENIYKKLYLERWKYYSGTATDKYYAEFGQMHHKVQKSDMDIYLNADDILCDAKEALEVCNQKVNFCEKSLKEISARTFHIRAAIDWRKFSAGG
jgi:hypothetical protein